MRRFAYAASPRRGLSESMACCYRWHTSNVLSRVRINVSGGRTSAPPKAREGRNSPAAEMPKRPRHTTTTSAFIFVVMYQGASRIKTLSCRCGHAPLLPLVEAKSQLVEPYSQLASHLLTLIRLVWIYLRLRLARKVLQVGRTCIQGACLTSARQVHKVMQIRRFNFAAYLK